MIEDELTSNILLTHLFILFDTNTTIKIQTIVSIARAQT
jgi:hypothetical protein